ncbi:MAG: ABC-F family ATP-binding cassette domain-containing protein [Proteobacteria bacterium]|jgi:ATP-binding cassette subfamily F protein 3|nr:ABC-F family ATP-binding cassette domain-containing protein [Pseudomonadota bacterium]
MLHVKGITYRVGGRTLFENASAHVPAGKRVGLVGPNGSGKTTLLRLALGELELDGGAIDLRARCSVGTVAQEAPGGERTPIEVVLAADTEREGLLAEAETCRDPSRIAEIHTRLADKGAHAAPARAAVILAGLGFDEAAQSRPLRTFSGGWRMRVALASALFAEPDLLLLDEPTNHLDLESVLWLLDYLKGYPSTLVVVSHDRHLLNEIAEQIVCIKDLRLASYTGGYDDFVAALAQKAALEDAARVKQEAARAHLQSFIDRFRAKATKAKQAQSRIKMLEKMRPVAASSSRQRVAFDFPEPAATASPLVRMDDVAVGYAPGAPVLSGLHLSVFAEDRVALLGANGNGKTTLARLLAGSLEPESGRLTASSKLVVGYFAQDHLEQLAPDRTAFEHMRAAMPPELPQEKVRAWLGRFGFAQERAEVRAAGLSGGEKTRLALALIAVERPNLLILDEPTNHLDVDAREALVEGLNAFGGAMILVSHDRRLIEATVDQLWLVEGGSCAQFFGDMDDYQARLLEARASLRQAARRAAGGTDASTRPNRKDGRRSAAEIRARLAPLKRSAADAEGALEALIEERAAIEVELADPSTYGALDRERIAALGRRQHELVDLVAAAEERWLVAADALERAECEATDSEL